jgi:predicted nucleic acid-binding protein
LVTCESAVAEACYLLRGTPGAPEAILENVANGVFQTPVRLADQASAVGKLLRKYRDVPMSLADACLVDLADRMDTGLILTLDRDFEIYRWRSRRKFELLIKL